MDNRELLDDELFILEKEVLKSLRGRFSQSAISLKLGFSFNQYSRWESGHKRFSWNDFLQICELRGISSEPLKKLLHYSGSSFGYSDLCRFLIGNHNRKELSRDINCSEQQITRWINGKTCPLFLDIIKLIDYCSLSIFDFLYLIHVNFPLPSFERRMISHQSRLDALYEYPLLGSVVAIMKLPAYQKKEKHESGHIAKKLGISLKEEELYLEILSRLEVIKVVNGKMKLKPFLINTSKDRSKMKNIIYYWIKKAGEMILSDGGAFENTSYTYRTCDVSKEGLALIKKAQVEYFNVINSILASDSKPPEHHVVLNTQIILPEENH